VSRRAAGGPGAAPLPENRLTRPLGELLEGVAPSWRRLVDAWCASPAGAGLIAHVDARRRAGATVYPATPFCALELTPLEAVRVVILGQDPYHGPGQAEGLAFSVPAGVALPPSLRNILAELARDLGGSSPHRAARDGHLGDWARQGVLLLNTVLTVEAGAPASHVGRGWEALTDAVIAAVADRSWPVTFMLWGAHAQAKQALIEARAPGRHRILLANHPSPLSARRPPRPFIGCGHFGQAVDAGVDWRR
jgi:uracil-DNA glycosylase